MSHNENELVYKSNALLEAAYTLTLAEQKIILAAITLVRRDNKEITDEILYEVTANALSDIDGLSAKNEYRDLHAAAKKLYDRSVTVREKPNGEGSILDEEECMFRWVQEIRYVKSQGKVRLRFSKGILPYLSNLNGQFQKYKLQYVAQMRSIYGIRLYELLIQWRGKGEREVEIDWLKQIWGIEGKYKQIKDFKKYVIDPAIADVNKCSDLWVKWGQRKSGRKVTHIQFRFGHKPGIKKLETKKRMNESEFSKFARPGESLQEAVARAKEEGFTLGFNPFAQANKKVPGQA